MIFVEITLRFRDAKGNLLIKTFSKQLKARSLALGPHRAWNS